MRDKHRQGAVGREPGPLDHRPGVVAPLCGLVQEAVSSRLDHERAPLDGAEIDAHLARCVECRAFEAMASELVGCFPSRCRATTDGVASVAVRQRSILGRASLSAGSVLWRRPFFGRLTCALPGMALAVVVPFVWLLVLAHFHPAGADAAQHCSALLHRGNPSP